MKHRFCILALALICSITAHADYFFKPQPSGHISIADVNRDGVTDIAAFIWEDKCSVIIVADSGIECVSVDEQRHKFYSPTVLIYSGKTGDIINYIEFFDEICPYSPVSITTRKNIIILTVRADGSNIVGDLRTDSYPDCQYNNAILTETRNLKTGKLIKQITLQDFTFP